MRRCGGTSHRCTRKDEMYEALPLKERGKKTSKGVFRRDREWLTLFDAGVILTLLRFLHNYGCEERRWEKALSRTARKIS